MNLVFHRRFVSKYFSPRPPAHSATQVVGIIIARLLASNKTYYSSIPLVPETGICCGVIDLYALPGLEF